MRARLSLPFFLVSSSIFIFAFATLFVSQVHAASMMSVTVTSFPSTGSGYVTVDGYNITTPATFTWTVGDNHTIAANSPVAIVPDQSRYIYADWSDGGKQSHTIIVLSQATTYTANFQLQYYLTVSGGYSTTGQGWYDNGTSVTASSNWVQSVQGNATGLVGLWHFDEGTGSIAGDSSGYGNNGTLLGNPPPSWVAGKFGDALQFSGSNYVQIPDSSSLKPTHITITAWINPANVEYVDDTIYSKSFLICSLRGHANHAGPPPWYPDFILTIGSTCHECVATIGIYPNNWYFIVGTYDGSTMKIYVNGVLGKTLNVSGSISWNTQVPFIGHNTWGGWAAGVIDEVRIYNRALSASEIQSLYYSRMAVTNWQLDGMNQNPARQNTGTLATSSIIMSTYHAVTFVSITQYLVSFQCMDYSGTENITPSSFQIEINNVSVISVSDLQIWLDNGTNFQIYSIIWENANVRPINQRLYIANTPLNKTILCRVFDAKFVVTDYLGIPVSDAQVFFTLANGTAIQLTTGSDGTLSLGLIPIGTFRATIHYLGMTTEIHCDASTQSVIIGRIFASYPTFSLIGGGIIATATGCVMVRSLRRSPPLRAKLKGYVKVNWGSPFILGFLVLLIVAADSLSMGLADIANEAAVYAFYTLVVGAVLQLVCFLKYSRRNGEKDR
jgi:hypothetical protein